MQYRIVNLRVKNFKCFDNKKYYEFTIDNEKSPIILSGPNGFGKTTFFDAIELLFSKNITRLDTDIERKSTNIGKNILLNVADEDGFIILSLLNESGEYLSLFAKILQSNRKLDVKNSIKYGNTSQYIKTSDLDTYFGNYSSWSDDVNGGSPLKYRLENFNVYYYVSQAESVHFLKKSIIDRKDAMNVLLNTRHIEERQDAVKQLIGTRTNSTGCAVNDAISLTKSEIEKVLEIIKHISNIQTDNLLEKDEDLKLYDLDTALFEWDNPAIEQCSTDKISQFKNEIKGLQSFIKNEQDFSNYIFNKEITNLLNSHAVDDYVRFRKYINKEKLDKDLIQKEISQIDYKVNVYNLSGFFRTTDISASLYKRENVEELMRIVPAIANIDIDYLSDLYSDLLFLSQSMSNNQKVIHELLEARKALYKSNENYSKESSRCPFCNTDFKSKDSLEKGFAEADKILNSSLGEVFVQLQIKKDSIANATKEAKAIINEVIGEVDDQGISELIEYKLLLQAFINDLGRIQRVDRIAQFTQNLELPDGADNAQMNAEIVKYISEQMKQISSNEFEEERLKYSFEDIYKKYKDYLNQLREKYFSGGLAKKEKHIEFLIQRKANTEIQKQREKLFELVKRKNKLIYLRSQLDSLNHEYGNAIDSYKNATLKELRVPLLIYTGKILQDYQNGLGVFVSKDEMRFVTNGDAKHDILNTFSSGQLSGFVMAFLFAMNKRYIRKSEDDLGFILIDDPVQTMDDINIASLIEVLRNDFSDKQIILSTHENDKENYILYKFFKYNQVGQSFNVKKEIYDLSNR